MVIICLLSRIQKMKKVLVYYFIRIACVLAGCFRFVSNVIPSLEQILLGFGLLIKLFTKRFNSKARIVNEIYWPFSSNLLKFTSKIPISSQPPQGWFERTIFFYWPWRHHKALQWPHKPERKQLHCAAKLGLQ